MNAAEARQRALTLRSERAQLQVNLVYQVIEEAVNKELLNTFVVLEHEMLPSVRDRLTSEGYYVYEDASNKYTYYIFF